MIFVDIRGGLGNQLFIYAFFRWLQVNAAQSGVAYVNPAENDHEAFQLYKYNICNQLAAMTYMDEFTALAPDYLRYCFQKSKFVDQLPASDAIAERNMLMKQGILLKSWKPYDEPIKFNVKHYYIRGFQGYKYFDCIKQLIMDEIRYMGKLRSENSVMRSRIKESRNAVCVHVRRGDFVNRKDYCSICTKAYYNSAINMLTKATPDPVFFVFSDSMGWAKKSIAFPESTVFVENNGENDAAEELELMRSCKHFIISNSSFSWWAQYLGASDESIVISPVVFESKNQKAQIIMDGWCLLDCCGNVARESMSSRSPRLLAH
ncbi:MAG: alpha-1,2-fucosyltransferase [Oscillospiraceae bacterium]|nr:alpha-1,2-fucosyltransferase [Oscillospiraceae bacterium]